MLELIILLVMLALGFGFGRLAESRHYQSIIQREAELHSLPVIASRIPPHGNPHYDSQLVTGSVVISVDYFKRVVANLRNIVGGRVTSYETLVDRARREAILRMKEQARELNAELIFHIKLETASIHKGRKNGIGSVEVLAYGTALIPNK